MTASFPLHVTNRRSDYKLMDFSRICWGRRGIQGSGDVGQKLAFNCDTYGVRRVMNDRKSVWLPFGQGRAGVFERVRFRTFQQGAVELILLFALVRRLSGTGRGLTLYFHSSLFRERLQYISSISLQIQTFYLLQERFSQSR